MRVTSFLEGLGVFGLGGCVGLILIAVVFVIRVMWSRRGGR